MKIEDSGDLGLGEVDLLPWVREWESPLAVKLLPRNFIREARVAGWYAQQCGARVSFATPGRLEYFKVEQAAWG